MLWLFIGLFSLATSSNALMGVGRRQSSAVEGTLLCDGQPASGVLVKLYDNDSGPEPDDLLDSGKTDFNGRFSLSGWIDDILNLDPKINIYHDCDDGLPCQRRITIYVPSDYVSDSKIPTKVYNAGAIELAGKFEGETRDCIH